MGLKEDRDFGKKASDLLSDYVEKAWGVTVYRTKPQYSPVDGILTGKHFPCFVEFMARKCKSSEYDTTILGRTQYNKIQKLYEQLGIRTVIMVLFTDGVYYVGSNKIKPTRTTKSRVYLPMSSFTKDYSTDTQQKDILEKYGKLVG